MGPRSARVFLHVCHGKESDPAPRRLQLQNTVRFRNIIRTLGEFGDLYWGPRQLDPDSCPFDVGMRGSLEDPVKLVFVPAQVRRPVVVASTLGEPVAPNDRATDRRPRSFSRTGAHRPKLMSPDPLLLLSRRGPSALQRSPRRHVAMTAPSRLLSPASPAHAQTVAASPRPLSYPSESITYTPQALWTHDGAGRADERYTARHSHQYALGMPTVTADAAPPRHNVPILQPPGLLESARHVDPCAGDDAPVHSKAHAELLHALQAEVHALRTEIDAVRATSTDNNRARAASASADRSPLPRWKPSQRWSGAARVSASPSARNPYLVDELADELHHAQMLRLAELRHL